MRLTLTLLLILFFSGDSYSQQTVTSSFIYGGLTRDYRIYIPASYAGTTAVPLLLNLHGYGSDNTQQEAYGDFRPIADTANFIIVHPNGTFDASFKRYWNSFDASAVNDRGFLSALIDTIRNNYNINDNRIYSTGMSNGGYMSNDMACFDQRIAAIASVTGSMYPPHKNICNPARPVPVMQIHGTADMVVPYNGSAGSLHIDTLVKFWVEHNNCSQTPAAYSFPNTNTSDGCTAERFTYSSGTNGSKVVFIKVTGGGHSWPGAPVDIAVTNHDFSASVEIWNFLRQFRLDQLMRVNDEKEIEFKVYPNPASTKLFISGFDKAAAFTFFDTFGRELSEIKGDPLNGFDISKLEAGVYFVRMDCGQTRSSKSFLIR